MYDKKNALLYRCTDSICRTYRALGFIVLGFNLIACILMKEKYPHKNKVKSADDGEQQPPATKRRFTDTFDWTVIKNVNFCMWMLASMISVAGYFIPYFYLPSKYYMLDEMVSYGMHIHIQQHVTLHSLYYWSRLLEP